MNIGDRIVMTEAVLVYDDLGHDLLIVGEKATVLDIKGSLLTVQTNKNTYDNVPIACVKQLVEEKAA